MADKVALMDSEYETVKTNLAQAHDTILSCIDQAIKQLEGLNTKGGTFYTDEISPKVDLLCGELGNARSSMETVYSAHREIVESFCSAVEELDTCC